MAYEKQSWQNGDVITAEKLNHMEEGISVGSEPLIIKLSRGEIDPETGEPSYSVVDTTYEDVKTAISNRKHIIIGTESDDEGVMLNYDSISYSIPNAIFVFTSTFNTDDDDIAAVFLEIKFLVSGEPTVTLKGFHILTDEDLIATRPVYIDVHFNGSTGQYYFTPETLDSTQLDILKWNDLSFIKLRGDGVLPGEFIANKRTKSGDGITIYWDFCYADESYLYRVTPSVTYDAKTLNTSSSYFERTPIYELPPTEG